MSVHHGLFTAQHVTPSRQGSRRNRRVGPALRKSLQRCLVTRVLLCFSGLIEAEFQPAQIRFGQRGGVLVWLVEGQQTLVQTNAP